MNIVELFEEGLIIPGVNTTPDIKPGETKRQAIKLGNEVDDGGNPPILNPNGILAKL